MKIEGWGWGENGVPLLPFHPRDPKTKKINKALLNRANGSFLDTVKNNLCMSKARHPPVDSSPGKGPPPLLARAASHCHGWCEMIWRRRGGTEGWGGEKGRRTRERGEATPNSETRRGVCNTEGGRKRGNSQLFYLGSPHSNRAVGITLDAQQGSNSTFPPHTHPTHPMPAFSENGHPL